MRHLIRVFEMPVSLRTERYLHQGGVAQTFIQVDWFDDSPPDDGLSKRFPVVGTAEWQDALSAFIRGKRYYRPDRSFLVLHPEHSFTINYEAPR